MEDGRGGRHTEGLWRGRLETKKMSSRDRSWKEMGTKAINGEKERETQIHSREWIGCKGR